MERNEQDNNKEWNKEEGMVEEASSRSQRKEGGADGKKPGDTTYLKWVGLGGLAALMIALVFALLAFTQSDKDAAPLDDFNINTVLEDVEYEAWMIHGEPEFVVIGPDIPAEKLAFLTNAVERHEGETVTGYYFDKTEAAEAYQGKLKDFHTNNLKIKVMGDGEGNFQTMTYTSFPQIEADATAVSEWELDADQSMVGEDDTFYVRGSIQSLAAEKDVLAQIKGLSNMTDLYNKDPEYRDKQFEMTSGAKTYVYHTSAENVLAQKNVFSSSAGTTEASK